MKLSPALLQMLSRSRLQPRWATATVGVGERRSRDKGAGMEFADHREYQVGDDLRHLDPHLYARLGEYHLRQYEVHRQLPIAILIDGSRSMDTGQPNRFEVARTLAALLGFVGLAHGDQVELGVGAGGTMAWSPRFHGASRSRLMFDWLEEQAPRRGGFEGCLPVAARHLPRGGLVIVISDWWEDTHAELGPLGATGHEIWGIHLLSREEMDPSVLGEGEVQLIDAESGQEVELALERSVLDQYARSLAAFRQQISDALTGVRGRYLPVPTDRSPEALFQREWRSLGLIA